MTHSTKPHLITHNGESLTITEWAARLNISRSIIYGRMRREPQASPERWFRPTTEQSQRYSLNGFSRTLVQWAKHYGMEVKTLRYRIAHMSLSDALTKPIGSQTGRPTKPTSRS